VRVICHRDGADWVVGGTKNKKRTGKLVGCIGGKRTTNVQTERIRESKKEEDFAYVNETGRGCGQKEFVTRIWDKVKEEKRKKGTSFGGVGMV